MSDTRAAGQRRPTVTTFRQLAKRGAHAMTATLTGPLHYHVVVYLAGDTDETQQRFATREAAVLAVATIRRLLRGLNTWGHVDLTACDWAIADECKEEHTP